MLLLLVVSCAVFLAAFAVGWWRYSSFFWNFIDLIYYPLAAVGVVLLFLASDVQRDLFEVSQLAERQRATLDELKAKRPNVQLHDSSQLLATHLDSIALVSRWGDICAQPPTSSEARCLAAAEFVNPVRDFLKAANAGTSESYEGRLLKTCEAADRLIEALRRTRGSPSIVGEKLSSYYAQTAAKKPHWLDYGTLDTALQQFHLETQAYIERIHRMAFKADDHSGALVLEVQKAELEYAEMVFRGLYPCMTSPRAELGRLSQWTNLTSTQAQEVARLDAERVRLKASQSSNTAIVWLQLNLWPLVLLAALSLKFAKGAATLRKAKKSAA
jgi:hypothetical protein